MGSPYDFDAAPPPDKTPSPPRRRGPGSPYDFEPTVAVEVPGRTFKPFGELKPAASPTMAERVKQYGQDALMYLGAKPYDARKLSEGLTNIAELPMGTVFSAADLLGHSGPAFVSSPTWKGLGSAALDAFGALPIVRGARNLVRGAPMTRPAYEPPPWARTERPLPGGTRWESPGEVAAINQGARSWVTPTEAELVGRGGAHSPLLGVSRQQYEAVRNAPVAFHPDTGPILGGNIEAALRGRFNTASAPGVYATVDRHLADWASHGGPVIPSDLMALRDELRNLASPVAHPGQGVAGHHAADVVENFMAQPPRGAMIWGTPQDQAAMMRTLADARGNYRAGMTAQQVENTIDRQLAGAAAIHSGTNIENKTMQGMKDLSAVNPATGEVKLWGATPEELYRVREAGVPGPWGGTVRHAAKFLGGGGGLGQLQATGWASAAGAGMGKLLGLEPVTTGAVAGGSALAAMQLGNQLTRMGNARAVREAESAAANIRRNSPEFAARAAANPEIINAPSAMRDAITYTTFPQATKAGQDVWSQSASPYENASPPPDLTDLNDRRNQKFWDYRMFGGEPDPIVSQGEPLRITVHPQPEEQ